jgi:hypothetical protein
MITTIAAGLKLVGEDAKRHKKALIVLTILFIFSRVALHLAGVRFDARMLELGVQLLDTELLKHKLLESLWYLHMQPPLFNAYAGFFLKCFGGYALQAFHTSFLAFGLIQGFALYLAMMRLDVRPGLAFVLTGLHLFGPATLLFENWFFYTTPVVTALSLMVYFLHLYLQSDNSFAGVLFFSALAAVFLTRSMFQLLWFAAIVLFVAAALGWRKKDLWALALPGGAALFWVAKNFVLWGVLVTSSWAGMNLSKMALPTGSSPAPWLPIKQYGDLVPPDSLFPAAQALQALNKRNGDINYNHFGYLKVSSFFLRKSLEEIKARPKEYLKKVHWAFCLFFQPADTYFFVRENARFIRRYSSLTHLGFVNDLYQHRMRSPLFAEAFFLMLIYALMTYAGARTWMKNAGLEFLKQPDSITVIVLSFTLLYAVLTGNLTELYENMRFRYEVSPCFWILLAVALNHYDFMRPKRPLRSS